MVNLSTGAVRAPVPGAAAGLSAAPPLAAAGRFVGLWRVIALVGSDALALTLCGLAACGLVTGTAPFRHPLGLSVAALVPLFVVAYSLGGLYPGFGVSAIQLLRTVARQTSLVFVAIVGSAYALPSSGEIPLTVLLSWWVSGVLVVPLMRRQVSAAAALANWWREPVILFGNGERVDGLADSLSRARHLGYRPVALVLVPSGIGGPSHVTTRDLPVISEVEAVAAAAQSRIRTILLAGVPAAEQKAADLRPYFRHVILVNPLEALLIEPTAVRYLGRSIGIEYRNGLLLAHNRMLKRSVDVAVSVVGLVVLFPLAAAAAVAIRIASPGPWWHAQTRVGRGGVPFRMWKLRTMFTDADARLEAHLASDVLARREWQSQFKLSQDPRVLPGIGRWLRRWSLDEYPQFWNVIRGQMSLVGPRPLPVYHLEAFGPDFRQLRQHVRPGMTGMWQVMSRSDGAASAQESLDRYYIYNWSIWMDAFLLAKTVMAVVTGHGAR